MTRWEYYATLVPAGETVQRLDALGAEGWECFAVEPDERAKASLFWLKRPLPAAPAGLMGRLQAAGYRGGEDGR